jgi:hypothetical protein
VEQVLLFRAYFGIWDRKANVAAVQYTTTSNPPETVVVIATSSTYGSHSEEKLLLFLEAERAAGRLGHIDQLYTERRPCNDPEHTGRDCNHRLQNSPLFTLPRTDVSYSFDYDRRQSKSARTKEEKEFKRQRDAWDVTSQAQNMVGQAQTVFANPGPGTNATPRFQFILPTGFEWMPLSYDERVEPKNPNQHDEARAYDAAAAMQRPRNANVLDR